ncbi:MAG: hypothetical protein GVY36_14835 [Verrucomicrobia bacterium]|jgi:hypothetical protein|nr:hypothetical protein [Verrucomicrobiota bacterium]
MKTIICSWTLSFFLVLTALASTRAGYLQTDTLYLTGGFQGVKGSLNVSREELRTLRGSGDISVTLIPRSEPPELTVLPFTSLIEAYPLETGFDGLVLETHNGWESFLTRDYIEANGTVLLRQRGLLQIHGCQSGSVLPGYSNAGQSRFRAV